MGCAELPVALTAPPVLCQQGPGRDRVLRWAPPPWHVPGSSARLPPPRRQVGACSSARTVLKTGWGGRVLGRHMSPADNSPGLMGEKGEPHLGIWQTSRGRRTVSWSASRRGEASEGALPAPSGRRERAWRQGHALSPWREEGHGPGCVHLSARSFATTGTGNTQPFAKEI